MMNSLPGQATGMCKDVHGAGTKWVQVPGRSMCLMDEGFRKRGLHGMPSIAISPDQETCKKEEGNHKATFYLCKPAAFGQSFNPENNIPGHRLRKWKS